MQTDIQYNSFTGMQRRRSKKWAVLLVISLFLHMVFQAVSLRFVQGANGRWTVTGADQPSQVTLILLLVTGLLGAIGGIGYLIALWKDKRSGRLNAESHQSAISGDDLLDILAWVQILQIVQLVMYGFLVSFPMFPSGTVPGMMESASLQIFLIIIISFWFRGRYDQIGFVAPKHLWHMVWTVIGLFVVISLTLNWLVTTPVADYFKLALESERENSIQNELMSATQQNWVNGLFSFLIVGVIAPIGEEMLFRGVIQTRLTRSWGGVAAILTSGFLFAFIHFDVAFFAPLFVIGIALGIVRNRFGNIWAPILFHCLNNSLSVLLSLFAGTQ